jgi:hypothetical protein
VLSPKHSNQRMQMFARDRSCAGGSFGEKRKVMSLLVASRPMMSWPEENRRGCSEQFLEADAAHAQPFTLATTLPESSHHAKHALT